MLFCPELNSVEMDDNGSVTKIIRGELKSLGNGISAATIIFTGAIETTRTFLVIGIEKESQELSARYKHQRKLRLQAAVEIDENNKIVDRGNSCGFYCVLPLVGIESQLNEPIYINCPDFEPDSERQSLILNGQEYNGENGLITEVGINRMIYPYIQNLYTQLLSYLVDTKAGAMYLMAKGLKEIKTHDKLDKEWYRDNVLKKYRDCLKEQKICDAVYGDRINLKDSIIVRGSSADKEVELFDIVSKIYPKSVLIDNHSWASIIWKDQDIRVWELEDLCKHISENFKNWTYIPNLSTDALAYWYNRFLSVVVAQKEHLLKEYALLPDIYGYLHKNDDSIRQNINISDTALNILRALGKDKNGELLHPAINAVKLEREYNSISVASDINNMVTDIVKQSAWLDKLQPLLAAIPNDNSRYPNHPGFCEKRREFFNIAKKLYGYDLVEVTENSLIADSWRELDKHFVEAVLKKLSDLGKVDRLPNGLDVAWLNK